MDLEKRSKKGLRSRGKTKPWAEESRRPWRNLISSDSCHIRWNLNGGGFRSSSPSSSPSSSSATSGSEEEEGVSGLTKKLGLGLKSGSGFLRLMGSLRAAALIGI